MQKPPNWRDLRLHEKIRYYGARLDSSYAPYVDKLEAKGIIEALYIPDLKVARTVRTLRDCEDLQRSDMNPAWILKATHGSGYNVELTGRVGFSRIKDMLRSWNRPFYSAELHERQYAHVQPRFYIEEKIGNVMQPVYMFRCIRGQPISCGVKVSGCVNSYDLDWRPLKPELYTAYRPALLPRMIELAKILSQPFEFVRIDLFKHEDTIYFSEYTFTPGAGAPFYSDELERKFGRLW